MARTVWFGIEAAPNRVTCRLLSSSEFRSCNVLFGQNLGISNHATCRLVQKYAPPTIAVFFVRKRSDAGKINEKIEDTGIKRSNPFTHFQPSIRIVFHDCEILVSVSILVAVSCNHLNSSRQKKIPTFKSEKKQRWYYSVTKRHVAGFQIGRIPPETGR